MELLMPAGCLGITLRATLVHMTSRYAAVAHGVLAADDTVLTRAYAAGIVGRRDAFTVVDFAVFEPATCAKMRKYNIIRFQYMQNIEKSKFYSKKQLTKAAFLFRLFQICRAHALVTTLVVDALGAGVTRVLILNCHVGALVNVDALSTLGTVMQGRSVTIFAPAVIPARHIVTHGRRVMTPMQIARAFVQVELAAVADETASTRASLGCHAFAAVLASLGTHSCERNIFL